MVQDPRVTTMLSRLGGLYRDPNRVDRDASSLLKSQVGIHLKPGISPFVENNGHSSHCLILQGTIAIHFRGKTYQLLVDIFLPAGYPIKPPISYVRLAENQYLKNNHRHVQADGRVYLDYTHEWDPRTHNLIEMVVAMSSVFSADPPVFARPAPVTVTPPSQPPPPTYSSYVSNAASPPRQSPTRPVTTPDSERNMREQLTAMMEREAEEANRVAEVVRRAEREEKELEEQLTAQKEWERKKLEQTRIEVNRKTKVYLQNFVDETKNQLNADWRDQEHLKQNKKCLDKDINALIEKKRQLEIHMATMEIKTKEIEDWLEESKSARQVEPDVDDLCQPVTKLDAQMLDLSAESAALSDTMYHLDRGIYMGQIDCTTHQKLIRKLAKKQFLIKAHLIKINQAIRK